MDWIFLFAITVASRMLGGKGLVTAVMPNCDSMAIMRCLQSTHSQNGQLFFPDTQQKLREYCRHLMTGLNCARSIIDSCVTPSEKEMYHNLTRDMVGMNEELCTPDSALSKRFLKHVDCYKSLSDRFRTCSDRYIGNIIAVQTLSQEEQMKMTCCTVKEYERCMRNAVEGRCDEDAQGLVEETVVTALKQSIGFCKQLGPVPTSDCLRKFTSGDSHETSNLSDNNSAEKHAGALLFILFLLMFLILSGS